MFPQRDPIVSSIIYHHDSKQDLVVSIDTSRINSLIPNSYNSRGAEVCSAKKKLEKSNTRWIPLTLEYLHSKQELVSVLFRYRSARHKSLGVRQSFKLPGALLKADFLDHISFSHQTPVQTHQHSSLHFFYGVLFLVFLS